MSGVVDRVLGATPLEFTDEDVLERLLEVPDDQWPTTFVEYPALATAIRSELERLRDRLEELEEQRAYMVRLLLDVQRKLAEFDVREE